MGFFQNALKDFSESGTPVGKLRKKMAELNRLLADYSYREGKLSLEMVKKNSESILSEISSLSKQCNTNDKVRLYGNSSDVEFPAHLAINISQHWIEFVLKHDLKLTESLNTHMINRAIVHNDNNTDSLKDETGLFSNRFKNFVLFMEQRVTYSNICVFRISDTLDVLQYFVPLVQDRIVKGYMVYNIEKKEIVGYHLSASIVTNHGQLEYIDEILLLYDATFRDYAEHFKLFEKGFKKNSIYRAIGLTSNFNFLL